MASIVAQYNAPLICFDKARAVQAMGKASGLSLRLLTTVPRYCIIPTLLFVFHDDMLLTTGG